MVEGFSNRACIDAWSKLIWAEESIEFEVPFSGLVAQF
jgi:hypothetical protein